MHLENVNNNIASSEWHEITCYKTQGAIHTNSKIHDAASRSIHFI